MLIETAPVVAFVDCVTKWTGSAVMAAGMPHFAPSVSAWMLLS